MVPTLILADHNPALSINEIIDAFRVVQGIIVVWFGGIYSKGRSLQSLTWE